MAVAVLLSIVILLQRKGGGLGSAFGGGDGGGFSRKKRGLEKVLFNTTIILSTALIVLGLVGLLIRPPAAPIPTLESDTAPAQGQEVPQIQILDILTEPTQPQDQEVSQ